MKSFKSIIALVLLALVIACGGNKKSDNTKEKSFIPLEKMNIKSLNEEIEKREKALNSDTNRVDEKKAARLMQAYGVYAENFSNYDLAAERLYKAGELAMSIRHTVKAIKYFEKLYNEYPKYEKRPYALFMKAFVLENQAEQYDLAKEIYEKFIEEYPNHPMADDAEYSILNMGKSPEELIREFEKRDSIENAKKRA